MNILSIIVPIYNVEDYLEECIQSILKQTFQRFEIILVNDGSSDSSGVICDEYKKKDNRIKVIHKENGGVSSARNIGLENAMGKYVAFVDPDDTIDFRMYEIMINKAINDDVDIVVCKIKIINNKLKIDKESKVWRVVNCKIVKEDIEKNLIPDILTNGQYSMTSSVNKIYKIDLLKKTNIKFDEEMSHGEDARFNLLLIQEANSIEFIDKALYNYYIRDRVSLTRTFNENLYDEIVENKNFGLKLCKKYNINNTKGYHDEYINNSINFIQDLIRSNLANSKKRKLVLRIINEKDFIEELGNYNPPSYYYKILKLVFKIKCYLLIKGIVLCKQNICSIYRREI